MFLVAGITGRVGGGAARALLDEGHQVRCLVRDPRAVLEGPLAGVDVRRGDLADASALADALEGVEGAFLLLPPAMTASPDYAQVRTTIRSYVRAIERVPPPRLVCLSSVGSERSSGVGHVTTTHLLEEGLGDVAVPTAFVRPGSFLENYVYALDKAEATGVFESFFAPADHAVPMVASADIGSLAARLLTESWTGKRIIEVGSRYSPNDLANAMTKVVGVPVEPRSVPRASWHVVFEEMGLRPAMIEGYAEMFEAFNTGWIDFGANGSEAVPADTSPEEVFARVRITSVRTH